MIGHTILVFKMREIFIKTAHSTYSSVTVSDELAAFMVDSKE